MSDVVLVLVPDLFFAAKIRTAAAHLGVELAETTAARLVNDVRTQRPARVIVDLHAAGALDAVRALRAAADVANVRVIGFYSHVDDATRAAALDAGVSDVMPRSAFTVKLAALLEGTA